MGWLISAEDRDSATRQLKKTETCWSVNGRVSKDPLRPNFGVIDPSTGRALVNSRNAHAFGREECLEIRVVLLTS